MDGSVVYFDTSLVIDYLLATGREPEAQAPILLMPESDFNRNQREYLETRLRHDKRYQFAARLRSIESWNFSLSQIVVSLFVLLELDEWYSQVCFKPHALEGTHLKAIQTYVRKQIGEFIKKVVWDSEKDDDSFASQLLGAIASSACGESLAGIQIDSVENLRFDSNAFTKVSLLSHMQLGMADIVHSLATESLNCTHFASTDSDFNRLRIEIEKALDFKVMFKDEIFGVVKAG